MGPWLAICNLLVSINSVIFQDEDPAIALSVSRQSLPGVGGGVQGGKGGRS
jgi:hypothetical protein